MRIPFSVLMLAGTLLRPGNVRAAPEEPVSGLPALNKAVDARVRALNLATTPTADEPLDQIAKHVPSKGALVRIAFSDTGLVQRGGQMGFIGRHTGVLDYAWVTFPADIAVSTNSSTVVIGAFTGRKTVTAKNGSKVDMPVIAASVIGVIDGSMVDGRASYAPNSPIHVYTMPVKEERDRLMPTGGFIKTLTEGAGPTPSPDDTVKVNYRGALLDGTVFDSSYAHNTPMTFPLRNVIPCWTNGVSMMKVGGKSLLICPPEAAYGDRGAAPDIAPGATLVFEVDLIEIVKH